MSDSKPTAPTLEPAPLEPLHRETGGSTAAVRGRVEKTYKLYVGGQFPRTESGRSLPFPDPARGGRPHAHIRRASRKGFRGAVGPGRMAEPEEILAHVKTALA